MGVDSARRQRLLEGLSVAQRAAVVSDAAPLCILAGAGSGKTRVLTRRIAWRITDGSADAPHVLALTFTRKAAGELRSRLGVLGVRDGVAAGTFHALAYAQLRRRWADRGERPPALLERKVRLLVPLLPRRRERALQPADVAAEIEWAKARMVEPRFYEVEAAAAGRTPPLPGAVIASIYDRYETEKRRRGLVDFDDLLLLAAEAIENDREFAAVQRWRFRHLFVDEFQDVNPLQHRLLEAWRGDRLDLCVVGDPNQAIYAWNGADASFLLEFRQQFPTAGIERLDDNYRSSPQVLAVANAVLGSAPRPTRPLVPHAPDGPAPTVRSYADDRDEARAIARAMRSRHGPSRPWSHLAVLTRTNAQLVLFQEALAAAGIPHRVRGGGAFLDQPEVRQALADLRRSARGAPLSAALADLQAEIGDRDGAGAPGGAVAAADGGDHGTPERRAHLAELLRLGRELAAADPSATVEGFAAWLTATVRADDAEARGDAVELTTFHGAKGLEWPVVFLAGLERGFVPIGHADTPEARAEERRLLYVAATRAQRELHCSWAERRTFGSRTHNRNPSPWLAVVDAAIAALAAGRGDWRDFLEGGRAQLRASDGGNRRGKRRVEVGRNADPGVLQALKDWRSSTARASGVPAFVIFHDTTLAAVAEAKPRDRASLLALPGMGPVKAERYGEALLQVVAQHTAS